MGIKFATAKKKLKRRNLFAFMGSIKAVFMGLALTDCSNRTGLGWIN
jgi:hypothetical protein